MNNRLFLYSSLFLVLILLFDASDQGSDNIKSNNQPIIPETGSQVVEHNNKPKDIIENKDYKTSDLVEVISDTLKVKIRLSDGALVSSELLKYPKYFESEDEKVVLLNNNQGSRYTALANIQSKQAKTPIKYTSRKLKYFLNNDDQLTVSIQGFSSHL